jgi:hypothetical protein
MGIIEFHLHDPEFDFSPSKSLGRGRNTGKADVEFETDEDGGGLGKRALVALLVFVVLGAAIGVKRRRSNSEGAEGDDTIQIRE